MYRGERFNSISHLVGAVAGLCGAVILIVSAAQAGDPWKIISISIYAATLFYLYLISTLYHSVKGKVKETFLMLDYHAVYLLIAGTYTPFALVTLRGAWGWSLFGVVWGLAAWGITLDSIRRGQRRIIPMIIYLVMGWLIVIALFPLLRELTPQGCAWLLLGGLFYTSGVYFYIVDKTEHHYHGIWHLFVLAGSVTHYFTVYYFVL